MSFFTGLRKLAARKNPYVDPGRGRLTMKEKNALAAVIGSVMVSGLITGILILMN